MTDMHDCPGRHTAEHPAPALRPEDHLCRSCIRHAERMLADLVALTNDLEATVTRQDRAGATGRRGVGHARPLPVNLDASDRARTVLELLFEWADFVAASYHMTTLPVFGRHVPLSTLVPRAVAVLLTKSDWMRLDPQGPDLANAIRCVRRDLRRLVDTPLERVHAGMCDTDLGYGPELDYRCRAQLFRRWGDDEIRCDGYRPDRIPGQVTFGCGTIHATADRRVWLRAEIEQQLLPLRVVWEGLYDLVPGCDVDWETARKWPRERRQRVPRLDAQGRQRFDRVGRPLVDVVVTPPRLEPQGWSGDTPLFRGSDILRLAEDLGARKGRRRHRTRRRVA